MLTKRLLAPTFFAALAVMPEPLLCVEPAPAPV